MILRLIKQDQNRVGRLTIKQNLTRNEPANAKTYRAGNEGSRFFKKYNKLHFLFNLNISYKKRGSDIFKCDVATQAMKLHVLQGAILLNIRYDKHSPAGCLLTNSNLIQINMYN